MASTSGDSLASERKAADDELLSASFVNKRILRGGIGASCCVIGMLVAVYVKASPENVHHLSKSEKDGAKIAFIMIMISSLAVVATFLLPGMKGKDSRPSPIVITSLLITSCSLLCNGLLAFAPVVTMMDPILGTKVYLIRWCEWIPLAGLMTYISDIVSLRKKEGDTPAILSGLSQSISCIPAIMFPFATNAAVWSLEMFIAIVFYLYMFPRLWQKYRIVKDTVRGKRYVDQERSERHKFGLYLFGVCTVVWTILVIMYFVNAFAVNFLPSGHILRHEASHILVDSTFDVIAKAFYCRLILDIHFAVFHKERVL